jgi:alginate O-acetyltransferase complex protein AlgI
VLFNSFEYLIMLFIVFLLYWQLKKTAQQNILLLLTSLVFYGWWDWRFLGLITFSAVVDYFLALHIQSNSTNKKLLLYLSLFVNLGLLGFFKYYNFFVTEFIQLFQTMGIVLNQRSLELILPVGISFYTFQTMSYTIDVYKGAFKARKNFIDYFLYVSFFPQLVAGPIERASDILPQLEKSRTLDNNKITNGLRQILWGLFKKIAIADNCARLADQVFANPVSNNSSGLLLGMLFFTIQIYADFSAYSDIAIGSARLFGIDLKKNFAFPLFARNIPAFWRQWHISLMNWFRDYIYIPLGGSRSGKTRQWFNIFIVFFLSGLWHGANWTFIVFGLVHALAYYLFLIYTNGVKLKLPYLLTWFWTLSIVVIGFTFFRATDVTAAYNIFAQLSISDLFERPSSLPTISVGAVFILFFMLEFLGRNSEYAIEQFLLKTNKVLRWTFYYALIFIIFYIYNAPNQFLYFQF